MNISWFLFIYRDVGSTLTSSSSDEESDENEDLPAEDTTNYSRLNLDEVDTDDDDLDSVITEGAVDGVSSTVEEHTDVSYCHHIW